MSAPVDMPSVVSAPFGDMSFDAGRVIATQTGEPLTRRAARAAKATASSPLLPESFPAMPGTSMFDSPYGDAFQEAVRSFGTSEIPIVTSSAAERASIPVTVHLAPRRGTARKFLTLSSTFSVMIVTGLLAIATTLPSEALAAAQGVPALSASSLLAAEKTAREQEAIQAFIAPEDVQTESLTRASIDYEAASIVAVAAQHGIRFSDSLYTNDPTASIQWPLAYGVRLSSGYGPRRGRMHFGIDLVPGAGAPIQAIAEGTVRVASEAGGGYGVHVILDHVIDGQMVTTHYAHMQYRSLGVQAGDTVQVGDFLGKVGNTGQSNGAHLHFEVLINGVNVNPLTFMLQYAGTHY